MEAFLYRKITRGGELVRRLVQSLRQRKIDMYMWAMEFETGRSEMFKNKNQQFTRCLW